VVPGNCGFPLRLKPDLRFRGNDSGVVGVINGETIANGPKNLPTILTGTQGEAGQAFWVDFG